MTNKTPWKILGMICLAVFLLAAPQIFAQDGLDDFEGLDDIGGGDDMVAESPAGDDSVADDTKSEGATETLSKLPEPEEIERLAGLHKFEIANPKKDPFKPLVVKKVILPPVRRRTPTRRTQKPSAPKPPPIKPIQLFVSGVVGNEGQRLAIVKFENKEYTIHKDQVVQGKFKVVDILNDRVVVYSNKEQRRHTFRIGGGKKGRR